ncbi:MAG: MFS transporter [Salinivenus sp.]
MPTSAPSETWLGTDRRVLALAVARMADAMGNSFLIIVLPLYVASEAVSGDLLGVPASLVAGVVLALFGVASSLTQPWAGHLSDRMGRRKPFVVGGLVVFAVVNLTFAAATQYWELFALRVVQGMAAAFTITASLALVNEGSRPERRGTHMGVYNAFRLVGFGGGPLLASLLVEMGPYRLPGLPAVTGFEATFVVAGGMALVSTVLVMLLVEDSRVSGKTARRLRIRVWARDGRGLDSIFALGLATLVMAACMALLSAIEPEVNQRLGQGPILFAVEFVALIAALAILQPIVGRVSDSLGRKPFVVVGMAALVPTTVAQGWVTAPWELIVCRILQGVAGAMVFAPALALAGDLATRGRSGAQLSVLTVAFGLGIAAGQITAGALVPFGFATPFVVGGALALATVAMVQTQVHEPSSLRAKPGGQ